MKKKNLFEIVGMTEDGKFVISNIFILQDTYGLPLQMTLDIMERKNWVISWPHFVQDALAAGWNEKKIKSLTHEVFVDSYSKEIVKELDEKIDFLLRGI
jgi:alanyl-tRNA synthetase